MKLDDLINYLLEIAADHGNIEVALIGGDALPKKGEASIPNGTTVSVSAMADVRSVFTSSVTVFDPETTMSTHDQRIAFIIVDSTETNNADVGFGGGARHIERTRANARALENARAQSYGFTLSTQHKLGVVRHTFSQHGVLSPLSFGTAEERDNYVKSLVQALDAIRTRLPDDSNDQ